MIQDRLKIVKLQAGVDGPDVMLGRQTILNCAPFHGWGVGVAGSAGGRGGGSRSGKEGALTCPVLNKTSYW